MPAEKMVFVDETGTKLGMARNYGWGPRNKPVAITQPVRGKHVNLIGAIGLDGVRASMTIEGSVNGEVFQVFLRDGLVPTLRKGDIVVMDNLSVHKVRGVRELIESAGARVLYLPPYSPDLNPIELTWAKVKSRLRAVGANSVELLNTVIGRALDAIDEALCRRWFSHCGYEIQST